MTSRLYFHFIASLLACALSQCSKKQSPTPATPPTTSTLPSTAVPVKIATRGFTRGGKPYLVNGVGGDKNLVALAARGGNSIRTWSTNGLNEIMDEAQKLNITVSAGIWLESECDWFSYKNPQHCNKQLERVEKEVVLYRDHPALLAWGIGNESEGKGEDAAYWQQLDRLAKRVRELDPHHPTFTAVAGLSPSKVNGLNQHTPHLDFVGVNTYGGAFRLREHLQAVGWKRPWLLTEWGPRGFWECKKAASGAPIEQTSSEKAKMMRDTFQASLAPSDGYLGNYAFVWGWKFESTATWFGLYTHEGETVASVDVLEEMWTGTKPKNTAPEIQPMTGVPLTAVDPGTVFQASVVASDAEKDPLRYHWAVLRDLQGHQYNTNKKIPDAVSNTIANPTKPTASVTVPKKPGIYRLYVWVKDGKGHAATANMPFEVK
jgi:Glycosyl hydrolases family 2, TIM barrel domain